MDPAGNQAQNSGVNCYKLCVKIIDYYLFSNQPTYMAAGHFHL